MVYITINTISLMFIKHSWMIEQVSKFNFFLQRQKLNAFHQTKWKSHSQNFGWRLKCHKEADKYIHEHCSQTHSKMRSIEF